MNTIKNPVSEALRHRYNYRKWTGHITAMIGSVIPEIADMRDEDGVLDLFSQRKTVEKLWGKMRSFHFEESLRKIETGGHFAQVDSRSHQVRNEMIHSAPVGLLNYCVRALVDESITPCIIQIERDSRSAATHEERELVSWLPFAPERLSKKAISRILTLPENYDTFGPHERNMFTLVHADTWLRYLANGNMTQRLHGKNTARIITFTSQSGENRVAIMKTKNTRNKNLQGPRVVKRTNMSIFETKETAIRSQNHAIESSELQIRLCRAIRAELIWLDSDASRSKSEQIQILSQIQADLEHMEWYDVSRVLQNIRASIRVVKWDRNLSGNFAFRHATDQLQQLMVQLLQQTAEIKNTLSVIEAFDQLN